MPFVASDEYLQLLRSKKFFSIKKHLVQLPGNEVNGQYFLDNGFVNPILIPDKNGLRLKVPDVEFGIKDVVKYVGRNHIVHAIDVRRQFEMNMKLDEFSDKFLKQPRECLLNVLSLEFSRTKMARLVEPPYVVKELSLTDNVWPSDHNGGHHHHHNHKQPQQQQQQDEYDFDEEDDLIIDDMDQERDSPTVQKYCLMSMSGSFTDFHVDFGGSSVWYHILWGKKVFYLLPPTRDNLRTYLEWSCLPNQTSVFFPDRLPSWINKDNRTVTPIYKLTVRAGNTILLPSGWIHAVFTPKDSLVFGGNFLHMYSVPMQLKIYNIETIAKTELRFKFPFFEKLHWFLAAHLRDLLLNYRNKPTLPPSHLLIALKSLLKVLPQWWTERRKICEPQKSYFLPKSHEMDVSCSELLRHLDDLMKSFTVKHNLGTTKSSFHHNPSLSSPMVSSKSANTISSSSSSHAVSTCSNLTFHKESNKHMKMKSNSSNICISSYLNNQFPSSSSSSSCLPTFLSDAPRKRLGDAEKQCPDEKRCRTNH